MRAIMVMYDSLNRRFLEPYGSDWVKTPNFTRLAQKTVTFDNAYVGSMPCMPARREIHTGRYNFLHRSWSPLEPFDDSMPEILKKNGIYSHIVSDHYHYWEDGGCTYHHRYSSWEAVRGQEGDWWKSHLKRRDDYPKDAMRMYDSEWENRAHYRDDEEKWPSAQTFNPGMEFMEKHKDDDNWFLTIETFDPHEPYMVPEKYKEMYPDDYDGPLFDWPDDSSVKETPEQVAHIRKLSAALHTMCDDKLGKVLDLMDKHDMWKDTMLIVNTDHGFLMSEHDLWAKCHCPMYNEVAHMPLFIWDPRSGAKGEHRKSLVQTIDLPATVLEFFGVDRPKDMQGQPLKQAVADDTPVREAGLFGLHGGHVNVTDGRYVYMRGPQGANAPLYQYTHMPTHMRGFFTNQELSTVDLAEPFDFTKGLRTMKIDVSQSGGGTHKYQNAPVRKTMLFDLEKDPGQLKPIQDPDVEKKMVAHIDRLMKENDAPEEQWERLGINKG